MPDTASPSVFISYSREDSAFVDRLEADLRARGFRTWVDRRRLEGGQNWQQEIDRAIDQHEVFVFVLSPASINSDAVRHEYNYAMARNKRIYPVEFQKFGFRYEIKQEMIRDFERSGYDDGLKALLAALLFQQLSLTAPSRELYERATALKGRSQVGDKEQAAVILQRILDRDPGYLQGLVKGDLDQLTQSLYPSRAQNLRQQVIAARKTGEYGVEASTLEALLALGHADPCAAEYLPIARQNSQFVDLYWVVQQQAANGKRDDARDKLVFLWSKAPYYRDPANLAPRLGLALPRSYEEVKAREGAEEHRAREEMAAKAELAQKTGDKNSTFERLRVQLAKTSYSSERLRVQLAKTSYSRTTSAYRTGYLLYFETLEQADIVKNAIVKYLESGDAEGILQQEAREVMSQANELHSQTELVESAERAYRGMSDHGGGLIEGGIGLSIFATLIACSIGSIPYTLNPANRDLSVSLFIISAISLVALTWIFTIFASAVRQTNRSRRSALLAKAEADFIPVQRDYYSALRKWQIDFEAWQTQRLRDLQLEFDQRMNEVKARHEQRIQEIVATYAIVATDPLLACWEYEKAV